MPHKNLTVKTHLLRKILKGQFKFMHQSISRSSLSSVLRAFRGAAFSRVGGGHFDDSRYVASTDFCI